MKYFPEVEDLQSLKALVLQDLKELGLKPPKTPKKEKKSKKADDSLDYGAVGVFNTHLCLVPSEEVDGFGPVPKCLIAATRVIEKHIDLEGLFRMAGSVARQKELKAKLENGENIDNAHPFDVASLIKQFFRNLPDPLLTAKLHDSFIKSHNLEGEETRLSAVLLLCLLLPWPHLSALRYFMGFLKKLSHYSDQNKMDIANLAIVLAPNLLHSNNKVDVKMAASESKMLVTQHSIIEMLITNAEDIGLVSKSLYDRTQLMSACFVSEDELDNSDHNCNDSKTSKKKKKRSGSFQGLVTNLSNSFSKWRKDNKGHNSSNVSDKSMMSMVSGVGGVGDKSSMLFMDNIDAGQYEYVDITCPEATPKIRKRKADDEGVPFSATKKKAILQNMPHMSTLGSTPFTPAAARRGHKMELMETPSIKFSENSEVVFNATPKLKMENLLASPALTTSKVKRTPSSRSGCFSPKSSKAGVRKSVRGFFKRLSGGNSREPNKSPGGKLNSSDMGKRLAIPDHITVVDPCGGNGKKRGKGRRKTPSSPARLVSTVRRGRELNDSTNNSVTSAQLAAQLKDDLCPERKRDTSSDRAIKRGRPNTLATGLDKAYNKRRSVDSCMGNQPLDTSSTTGVFISPPKHYNNLVASTVDTSPIQKVDTLPHECSPIAMDTGDMDEGHGLARQTSTSSAISNMLSMHDQAFIQESDLLPDPATPEGNFESPNIDSKFKVPKNKEIGLSESGDFDTSQESTIKDDYANDTRDTTTASCQLKYESCESLDSAIDGVRSHATSVEQLSKAGSMQSLDSGVNMCCDKKVDTSKVSLKDDEVFQLQRQPSLRKKNLSQSEPNVQVSQDVHNLLTKVGVVSTEQSDSVKFISSANSDSDTKREDNSIPKDILERHTSPLRFPNSPMRKHQRGTSPIRIPTIFAKADQEAQKYRDMVTTPKQSVTATPKSVHGNMRKPSIPIDSVTISNRFVKDNAKSVECTDTSKEPLKDSSNTDSGIPATPKIKPILLSADQTKKLVSKMSLDNRQIRRLAKSPVKPVKRLQGSPKSPRRPSSPLRHAVLNINPERLSPIPAHVTDWNV